MSSSVSLLAAATSAAVATALLARHVLRIRVKGLNGATTPPRVLVASEAQPELAAARAALVTAEVSGVAVDSGVAKQPASPDETIRGARNRMTNLMRHHLANGNFEYALAIEDGLWRFTDIAPPPESPVPEVEASMAGSEKWVDVHVVILRHVESGKEVVTTSPGVQVPTEAVAEWAEAGCSEDTVGAWLAQEMEGACDDMHGWLTATCFPRVALLESTIRIAHAQMTMQLSKSCDSNLLSG